MHPGNGHLFAGAAHIMPLYLPQSEDPVPQMRQGGGSLWRGCARSVLPASGMVIPLLRTLQGNLEGKLSYTSPPLPDNLKSVWVCVCVCARACAPFHTALSSPGPQKSEAILLSCNWETCRLGQADKWCYKSGRCPLPSRDLRVAQGIYRLSLCSHRFQHVFFQWPFFFPFPEIGKHCPSKLHASSLKL